MTQPNDAIIERTRNELSRIAGCQRNSKRADRLIEWHLAALEAAGSVERERVCETFEQAAERLSLRSRDGGGNG